MDSENQAPTITQWEGKSPALDFVALSQIPRLLSKSTHKILTQKKDKKQKAIYENNSHNYIFS